MEDKPKKSNKNNWCTENNICEIKELSLKKHQAIVVKKQHKTHCKKNQNKIITCFVQHRCRMSSYSIKLQHERCKLNNMKRKFSHGMMTVELLRTSHR